VPYRERESSLLVGNLIADLECWLSWTEILNMEGGGEEKAMPDQSFNVEKYRRLVKSYIDLVGITGP
jgi:hypothetical protein